MNLMNREEDKTYNTPLTAEELIVKLRQGKKTVDEIRMGGLVIPVRVISCDEVNQIRREAIRKTALVQGDETDKNLEIQKNTLKLASTLNPGTGSFLTDKLLTLLSYDEISYLYQEFIRFMDNVNPSFETITQEMFRSIIDALKKKIISTKDLSLHQLQVICTAYVDLILRLDAQTSPQDN